MRLDVLVALGIGSALALGGTALGQQVAPPPGPPADYGPPITNEQAKTVAAAALAEAKKNNSPVAFAIVGPAGELVYFEKMDGTQLASVEIAQGKARTALLFRRPSKVFADQYAAGNRAFTTFPEKPVASEGGVSDCRERQDHRRDRGERRRRLAGQRGSAAIIPGGDRTMRLD